ncbi:uncharacterized protein LOC123910761 [Trifolium pratense]|uniref:uncharacterized protein LOC123910761 n=1 Tax=Trifolium pratense TaxID=57577 RepID=UPI001E6925A4|nr:uncharacterized protein LOC123910761 [Trifolium pratense]
MEKTGDESPKNKVKFLCSYGGKVLPRPSDGVLKYVGGETRVVCVPRDITFSEMMKKVNGMVDGEVVFKYQVIPEELDALVTVRTDEDLKHMIEEHDRHGTSGSPLLRTFLFPSKALLVDTQIQMQGQPAAPHPVLSVEPYWLEQRYLDAINGIVRRTSPRSKYAPHSACSSPKSTSPDGHTNAESPFHTGLQQLQQSNTMQRVRSSPSLSNLTSTSSNNTQASLQPVDHGVCSSNNHSLQKSSSCHHYHHHPPLVGYRPIQEQGIGMGMGRSSPWNMNMMIDNNNNNLSSNTSSSRGVNYYYSTANRPHKAYAYHDDSAGHIKVERVHSVPRSPKMSIWE